MKQPKLADLKYNEAGTQRIRDAIKKTTKIKVTINIDEESLIALKKKASKSGASYQKLLNSILREGLSHHSDTDSRLERIEKELEKIKRKIVA